MLQVLEKRIVHQSFEKAAVVGKKQSLQQQLDRSSSGCSSIASVNSSSSSDSDSESDDLAHIYQQQHQGCKRGLTGSSSSSGSDLESDDLVNKDQQQLQGGGWKPASNSSSSSSSASSRCSSICSCVTPLQPAGNAAAGYVPYWLRAYAKQQQSSASGSGVSTSTASKQQAGGSGQKRTPLQLRPRWV
jgi:hypothetical protein